MFNKDEKVMFKKEYKSEVMGIQFSIPKGTKALVVEDNDIVLYLMMTDCTIGLLSVYGQNGHEVSISKDDFNPYEYVVKR